MNYCGFFAGLFFLLSCDNGFLIQIINVNLPVCFSTYLFFKILTDQWKFEGSALLPTQGNFAYQNWFHLKFTWFTCQTEANLLRNSHDFFSIKMYVDFENKVVQITFKFLNLTQIIKNINYFVCKVHGKFSWKMNHVRYT